MKVAHLPVSGIYERGINRGRAYAGFVSSDPLGALLAFPPGVNTLAGATICADATELRGRLSLGWKTRVDVGDGKPASILKARAGW